MRNGTYLYVFIFYFFEKGMYLIVDIMIHAFILLKKKNGLPKPLHAKV